MTYREKWKARQEARTADGSVAKAQKLLGYSDEQIEAGNRWELSMADLIDSNLLPEKVVLQVKKMMMSLMSAYCAGMGVEIAEVEQKVVQGGKTFDA